MRFAVSLLVLGTVCSPPVIAEGICGDNSPALPVPECRDQFNGAEVACSHPDAVRLWPGGWRPGSPGQVFPPLRDSTQWSGVTIPGAESGHELFRSLDVQGDYLYVAYNAGLQVWDVGGGNAENPPLDFDRDGWRGDFLAFPPAGGNSFVVDDLAAIVSGGDTLVALSGRTDVGLSLWRHQTASADLIQLYQDLGNRSQQVRAVDQAGTLYAFAAGLLGIFVYDMSAAEALASPCLDDGGTVCPGVFRGKLGTTGVSLFLDVIQRAGKVYVARSGGVGIPVEIWEISDPASPGTAALRFSGLSAGAQGLAFFSFGGINYLAVVERIGTDWRLRIYNVDSCLDANGCGSLGSALFSRSLGAASNSPQFLTFSTSDTAPFLYYGVNQPGLEGAKVEQLFDLTGFPGAVTEITDSGSTYLDDCTGNAVDYWGDYYPGNGHGLRNLRPMVGKFNGDFFYRAAYGILDVHVRENVAPPLEILNFEAACPFGFCIFCLGDTVLFQTDVIGTPELYEYDWDGDGSFEESSSAPIVSHVYDMEAFGFFPQLRISAGGEADVFVHADPLIIENCEGLIFADGFESGDTSAW